MVDLSRPCDACGGMVGGDAKCCYKRQTYFCFVCSWQLMNSQNKFPVECPMWMQNLFIMSEKFDLEVLKGPLF
jgi:hypothetical protein